MREQAEESAVELRPSLQARFARALLDPTLPVDELAVRAPDHARSSLAQRFAVHRNNVLAGLVNGLLVGFPATLRLLGEEFFRAIAAEYVRASPPTSPVLHEYGATLADYLRRQPSLQSYRYVADVAQLEWLRRRAFHSADNAVLDLAVIRTMSMSQLLFQSIRLHPSVQLLQSDHPVVSLWRSQVDALPAPDAEHWHAEIALVWRAGHTVQVASIDAARLSLLRQFQASAALADAMAATGVPLKDITPHFSALAQAGVLCAGDAAAPI